MRFQPVQYEQRPLGDLLADLAGFRPDQLEGLKPFKIARGHEFEPPCQSADDPFATRPGALLPPTADSFLPSDHPNVDVPGVMLENYLAGGSQGWVYTGRVLATGRLVAVKILRQHDPGVSTSAIREALICARIRHPNVLRVFQVQSVGGFSTIIAELVQGSELSAADANTAGRHRLFGQLCDALAVLASNNVVHRDIKPENVMIRQFDGSPVLVDFGLAVDLEFPTPAAIEFSGTPYYMPPEAFSGTPPDPSWDAYALGVTATAVLRGITKAYSKLMLIQQDKKSGHFNRLVLEAIADLPDDIRTWIRDLIALQAPARIAAIERGREWLGNRFGVSGEQSQ